MGSEMCIRDRAGRAAVAEARPDADERARERDDGQRRDARAHRRWREQRERDAADHATRDEHRAPVRVTLHDRDEAANDP